MTQEDQPEPVQAEPAQPEQVQSEEVQPEPSPPEKVQTVTRRGVAKNLIVVAIFLVFTLVVGVAFAYYGTSSVPGGNGASAATSVSQGATPTVTAGIGSVTVAWSATTLATGRAVTGYTIKRYDAATLTAQTMQTACTGVIAATTCTETDLPTGQWQYTVTPRFATSWLGPEGGKSPTVATVAKDTVTPVNAITLPGVPAGAVKNGNTIYYRGSVAGSFTLTNAVTDSGSGPASSTTQALTGTTTGWTHTPSTVSTPVDGPYVSSPFSWAAATTSAPVAALVGRDVQDNATTTSLTFVNDSTNPTAAVSYPNGYVPGRSIAVTFSASDAGSGLAATRQLQRSSAPLSNGVCLSYSTFTRVGTQNPTSPYTDTQVANGSCYRYRYVVTDNVGNQTIATSVNVARVDYEGAVNATTGLLSHWRLGEKLASWDTFAGSTGTALSLRNGEIGATWTKWRNDFPSAVLTDAGRLRRSGTGGVTYLANGVPPTANYQVAADIVWKSEVAGDYAGVVGRALVSDVNGQGTRYSARYSADANAWELLSIVGGAGPVIGTFPQLLEANQSYRLTLDMNGSSIRLLVNGVQRIAVTDTTISGAGIAGVRLGAGTAGSAPTNFSGMHVDNFKVTPRAVDSRGPNPGTYVNQPTLSVAGAIEGDADTAAVFDGAEDYVQMLNTTGLPVGASVRSVEAWFKTTSPNRQVLFNYGTRGTNQEFGLWLSAGSASFVAWGFAGDRTFSLPAPVNDGAWHQVVKTYDGTSITIYLDGVALPAQAATRATAMDAFGFGIGAVIVPGDANSGGYFNGALDEVAFYTTALNQATVTSHYQLGTSPAADVSGPTGGSVDVSGLVGTGLRYSTSTTLNVDLAAGTDPSGMAGDGAQLLRATATLTSAGGTANGSCGTFGSYSLINGGEDPTSPVADTVADGACYSYRYVVQDSLGNTTRYTSTEVKVETTGPSAPTLSYSALSNTSWNGSGSTVVYYRPTATTGSFTATASATDARSGIASYAFPALGTNWTSTPGALGVNTYSWSGAPAAPGTKGVTATNNATITSASSPFTLTADSTAPTAGTVSYPSTSADTSVNVSFTTGTDSGSGVGTRLLQRASAPLTGTTCGTFSSFVTAAGGTNPTSPLANTVTSGTCYTYRYVVSDKVGNSTTATSATVLKVQSASYAETVQATAGLVSHWRLGDSGTSDTFTGTAGAVLSSRAADSGATWTRRPGDTITAVFTDQGRLRKSTVSGGVAYYISDSPASADYVVEADVHVKSLVGTAGVMGRLDSNGSGTGTYYFARYDAGSSQWQLIKNVNGSPAIISTSYQLLTVGATYRLSLDMKGTALRVLVNGEQRISINDGTITAAGRAAVGLGEPGDAATPSDTQGLHLDNFGNSVELVDSYGTNNGRYVNGPTRGTAGALTRDSDTAVIFDGVAQHGTAARQISDDLSIEFWFKSTQGIGTGTQWWEGAGLVDAEVGGATNDFGVSLRSDGRVVGGIGSAAGDVSIVSSNTGLNDGGWHHVVFTRVQATGAIRLYVDGALVGSGTAGTGSLTAEPSLTFGRLATGGNAYAGSLDEIAVYGTALAAATVSSHYAAR